MFKSQHKDVCCLWACFLAEYVQRYAKSEDLAGTAGGKDGEDDDVSSMSDCSSDGGFNSDDDDAKDGDDNEGPDADVVLE